MQKSEFNPFWKIFSGALSGRARSIRTGSNLLGNKKSIIWSTLGSCFCAEYLVSPLTPGGRSNQGLHLQGKKLAITTRQKKVICRRLSWHGLRRVSAGGSRGGEDWALVASRHSECQQAKSFKFTFCQPLLAQKHGCHYRG